MPRSRLSRLTVRQLILRKTAPRTQNSTATIPKAEIHWFAFWMMGHLNVVSKLLREHYADCPFVAFRTDTLESGKMNQSEYPFSTFNGIEDSLAKTDIATLKGATGKTISNHKKEICRWISSLNENARAQRSVRTHYEYDVRQMS